MKASTTAVVLGAFLVCQSVSAADISLKPVSAVPDEIRREWKLDAFYQKYTPAGELPVVGSARVTDFALLEGAYIVTHMLAGRDDILHVLATNHAKIVIMAHDEYTTDLPEQRNMKPSVYWDSRARGMGGRTCSGAEENLLCLPGDPYSTENILVHEFGHVIQEVAMRAIDPTFTPRLKAAFEHAALRGLWTNTYAGVNSSEYWAESVQDWFDNNRHDDALHNHIHTRAALKEYDPEVAKLCAEVFDENPWRYLKPMERPAEGRAHLAGYDPANAPHFHWRNAPMPDKPRVVFETAQGNFEVELDAKAAPVTTSNFLYYVHNRLYNDGRFYRTVTMSNQPTNQVKIQVIQAEANQTLTNQFLQPIRLERTSETVLHHLDGTISMARDGPDTARDSFFICIGDQPELDFGGKRNPDGQGFAAFGKVTSGMELLKKIHASPAQGQQLEPAIRIQRAVRQN